MYSLKSNCSSGVGPPFPSGHNESLEKENMKNTYAQTRWFWNTLQKGVCPICLGEHWTILKWLHLNSLDNVYYVLSTLHRFLFTIPSFNKKTKGNFFMVLGFELDLLTSIHLFQGIFYHITTVSEWIIYFLTVH